MAKKTGRAKRCSRHGNEEPRGTRDMRGGINNDRSTEIDEKRDEMAKYMIMFQLR